MRNSSSGLLFSLLALGLGILFLVAFQNVWLAAIGTMLKNNQSAGLPISSTPVSGFSFPTARAPGRVGEGLIVGKIALYVTGVVRNANVGANDYTRLKNDEEYLRVDISVNCRSESESCRLTEFDFGVRTSSGRDIPADLSMGFSDGNQLFEGGEIAPGENMSGALIFTIRKDDSGLMLYYPRMFAFGNSAEFVLGP